MLKSESYYLHLKYPITMTPDDEVGFFVEIPDLPGCWADGETVQEAYDKLEVNKREWVHLALDVGNEIQEPRTDEDYSGQFLIRMPKSLHHALAEEANSEGVSMNQYIVALIIEKRHIRPVVREQEKPVFEVILHVEERKAYFEELVPWEKFDWYEVFTESRAPKSKRRAQIKAVA
jgi:predicted RNase H-like HicB family nuclease